MKHPPITVCPRSSDPFYYSHLLYKMGHYFLDTQYVKVTWRYPKAESKGKNDKQASKIASAYQKNTYLWLWMYPYIHQTASIVCLIMIITIPISYLLISWYNDLGKTGEDNLQRYRVDLLDVWFLAFEIR